VELKLRRMKNLKQVILPKFLKVKMKKKIRPTTKSGRLMEFRRKTLTSTLLMHLTTTRRWLSLTQSPVRLNLTPIMTKLLPSQSKSKLKLKRLLLK